MERLTTRCAGHAVKAWEHEEQHTTQEWIDMLTDRLAYYEDLEEQGRLFIPPCAIGKTVWCISRAYKMVSQYTVAGYLHDGIRWKVRLTKTIPSWVGNKTEHKYVAVNAYKKTFFLTREEAEKALKEDA